MALLAEDTIRQFTDCLCEVEAWMRASRLRLNPQKTQLIWLGSRQQLDKLNITDVQLLSTTLHPQSTVRSLGVILDSQLTMSSHITSLCRSGYYQLRQLRGVIQSLTPDATKTLVHAFIRVPQRGTLRSSRVPNLVTLASTTFTSSKEVTFSPVSVFLFVC